MADVHRLLHRPLPEGGFIPHNHGAAVILKGRGQNFRGGCAEFINEHHNGAIEEFLAVVSGFDIHVAAGVLDLHHGAVSGKEARHQAHFLQGTAAVAAQVNYQAIHIFLVHPFQDFFDILGTAAVSAFHVCVEGGKAQHANAVPAFRSSGKFNDFTFGKFILQRYLGAGQRNDFGLSGGVCRLYFQAHLGIFGSADHIHHFVQLHEQDIHHFSGVVGVNGNDAVVQLQFSGFVSRSSHNDTGNFGGTVVFTAQQGADAGEFRTHGDFETVHLARTHVIRMRVIRQGYGAEQCFRYVFQIRFLNIALNAFITHKQFFLRWFLIGQGIGLVLFLGQARYGFTAQDFGQELFLHHVFPDLLHFRLILGPRGCFAAGTFDRLVFVKGEASLFQQIPRIGDALHGALAVKGVHGLGRIHHLAGHKVVVQLLTVFSFEGVYVLLGEEYFVGVYLAQVGFQEFGG